MIPKLHYISQGTKPEIQLAHIQKACSAGIELVRLCCDTIPKGELLKTVQEARTITAHFQTRLILTDQIKMAQEIKADGVYITQNRTSILQVREQLHPWQSIGVAAHTLQDCECLLSESVDYIVLGPYHVAADKTKSPTPLGILGFTGIMEALQTETPFIGQGNITTDDVKDILETGVSGLAVSTQITADFNTIRTFNQLLNASVTQEQRHTFK